MKKGAETQDNRQTYILAIILILIGIIALTLTGVIVFNAINSTTPEVTNTENNDPDAPIDPFYDTQTLKNILDEAEKIYAENPEKPSLVEELFANAISKTVADNRSDYTLYLVQIERQFFQKYGLAEIELSALLKVDVSPFPDDQKYKIYSRIVELAEQLNDAKIKEKYAPLAAETKAAYDAEYEAIEKGAERAKQEIENAKAAARENNNKEGAE